MYLKGLQFAKLDIKRNLEIVTFQMNESVFNNNNNNNNTGIYNVLWEDNTMHNGNDNTI